jgi:uracil-DNA glycosylase family 4
VRAVLQQDQDFCHGCPLFREKRNRTVYVPTDVVYDRVDDKDLPKVDLLVVGEAPGKIEDYVGMPFAGESGKVLRSALRKAGIDSSFAISNVVRCRPRDEKGNNRPTTVEEIAACSNYIHQDIKQLDPKVIVLVGNQAIRLLAEKPEWEGKSVRSLQGQVNLTKDGKTHLVTVHPSSFIRSSSAPQRRRFFRHIKAAGRFVSGKQTVFSSRGETDLIDDIDYLNEVLDWFEFKCKVPVAIDSETQNLNHVAKNKVATIQLSADNDHAYVIPLQHPESPWTKGQLKHIRKRLRRLLGSAKSKIPFWIMHNAQFDMGIVFKFLRLKSIAKPVVDTMFLAYLQDENQCGDDDGGKGGIFASFALKTLVRELLGFYYYDTELSDAMAARAGAHGGSLWDLPLDRLAEYGGTDAYVTRRLFEFYRVWLERQGYKDAVPFSKKWYSRVAHLFVKMTVAGFPVDTEQLDYLRGENSPILTRLSELPGLIHETPEAKRANGILLKTDDRTAGMKPLFGKKPWVLNIRKKNHRIKLFVDACGLDPISLTKKSQEPQIDKAYFEHYKQHPVIQLYKEYSGLDKLRSSYLESVDEILYSKPDNKHDGRIHAQFHATRTVTGRAASKDPNLQQLPKGMLNSAKAAIRSMYGASPGHILIECDYGQAEVRWWAQLARDKQYAKLFREMKALRDEYKRTGDKDLGKKVKLECDIHKKVASLMFRLALGEITKPLRDKAKALCFGSIYGQHYKTLAVILGITPDEALELQETFIKEFARAGQWLTDIECEAETFGLVSTPMGRIRHLADMFQLDENGAKRRARNSPIQAVSSDTTTLAAWRIQNWIETNNRPYKVINCVHDAVTMEVPLDYGMVEEAVDLFQTMMVDTIDEFLFEEFGIKMIVPMEIDYDLGVRWGHMLGYDGVRRELRPVFDRCVGWDQELSEGVPWNEISYREFDFWGCKCGVSNHDTVDVCGGCGVKK